MTMEPKKLEELLNKMYERIDNLEQSQSTAKNTSTKGHNHSLSEVLDCPECGPLIEKYYHERHKPKEEPKVPVKKVKCLGCGEEIDVESENCPECGGEYYEE